MAEPLRRPGYRIIKEFTDEKVVGITVFKGVLVVATDRRVYQSTTPESGLEPLAFFVEQPEE